MTSISERYQADLERRVRLAVDYNDGAPYADWSTGERVAVALVLNDDEYLSAEVETRETVLSRIAGDIQGSPNDAALLIERVRESRRPHPTEMSAYKDEDDTEGEDEDDRACLAGLASELNAITERLADAGGALIEARQHADVIAGLLNPYVDGEPSERELADLTAELDEAERRVRAADRVVHFAANECDDARERLDLRHANDPAFRVKATGPVRVRLHVEPSSSGFQSDIVTIEADEWNGMTPGQRERHCTDMAIDMQQNEAPCGFEVLGPDDEDEEG